ncbi:MAG: arabinose operon transcriptional regulator AraC [Kiritimatiellaeota bacterium]|nr:arabinose operon transcriptional regulator AraC [Kiritimatiellota bacterium]
MRFPPEIIQSGTVGRGQNNRSNPHHVYRPGGTDIWILEYTVSGRGWIRAGQSKFLVESGDFLLFKPAVLQDYGMDKDAGAWDHIWFCFAPWPHWYDWLAWPERAEGILHLPIRDTQARRQLLARMEDALKLSMGIYVRKRDFVMNIIEEILLTCDIWNPASRTASLDDRIRTALNYMCANSAKKITLADLGRVCSLSPSRLSHLFKRQMGETPMQYLEQRRIERAKDLLQMTSKTVAQVAYAIGFENPFYFSRVFKRRTGKSPRQIRQPQGKKSARKTARQRSAGQDGPNRL